MDKLKQYIVFTLLGCLGVMAAGWFLLVSPKRAEAAELRAQAEGQVTSNAQLETQLAVLKSQAKDLPKQQAKLAAVAAKIPSNPAMPGLVRALVAAGQSAGVEILTVTPGAPELVTAAAAAPVAPVAPNAAAAAAPAAAPVVAAPAASAGGPVVAGTRTATSASDGQLARIPLTLSVAGGYFQVEQFIANLENLPRSMRITTLAVAPGVNPVKKDSGNVDDGKSLIATVTGQVFMATNRAPIAPIAAPAPAAPVTVAPAKK